MILSLKSCHSTNNVTINADGSCGGGWVCEHRWNVMKKMVMMSFNELKRVHSLKVLKQVKFRNSVVGTSTTNYWNNGQAVAFSRGNRAFFAMAQSGFLNETLQTGENFQNISIRQVSGF